MDTAAHARYASVLPPPVGNQIRSTVSLLNEFLSAMNKLHQKMQLESTKINSMFNESFQKLEIGSF